MRTEKLCPFSGPVGSTVTLGKDPTRLDSPYAYVYLEGYKRQPFHTFHYCDSYQFVKVRGDTLQKGVICGRKLERERSFVFQVALFQCLGFPANSPQMESFYLHMEQLTHPPSWISSSLKTQT